MKLFGSGISLIAVKTPQLGGSALVVLHTPQICKMVLDRACCMWPVSMDCIVQLHALLVWPWGFCREQGGLSQRSNADGWATQVFVPFPWHIKQPVPRVTITLVCSLRWMASPLWTHHTLILHHVSICQGVRFLSVYI